MASIPEDKRSEIIRALRPEDEGRLEKQTQALLSYLEGGGWDNLHPALQPWVDRNAFMGPVLKHPFVYCPLGDGGELVGQANRVYEWKIKVRREYLNDADWMNYIWSLERPWRMFTLERLWGKGRISKPELRQILLGVWTDTEMPQVNQDVPLRLFHAAGFLSDRPKHWVQLPEEITLYRGVDGEFELTADGPSWTLDKKVAQLFAYRFGAHGTVYRYVAKKSEALAYITARDEAEILLDFNGVSDASRIEEEETWHE